MSCVRSIRVHTRADVIMNRELENGDIMRVPAYFSTRPQDVNAAEDIDLDAIVSELLTQCDSWQSRGSNFVIERIVKFVVCITKYRPMHGSSFIETPKHIAKKKSTVNIYNTDQKCFLWSVLACLHPPSGNNPNRVSHYIPYEHTLNVDGLSFPLQTKDIPKFESKNPTISINVLSLDGREFCIEYCSPERQRPHHVNLLLLDDESTDKRHYIWVKNMSRLVGNRTKHKGKTHVCNGCLYPFSRKDLLDKHILNCFRNPPQMVKYPDPKDENECTVKFREYKKQFRLPFYLVCDFEAFLTPIDDNCGDAGDDDESEFTRGTRPIDEHRVCGFACHRVTDIVEYQTAPVVYSGPDVMSKFYEHVMRESEIIGDIVNKNNGMHMMTEKQKNDYDVATHCGACGKVFSKANAKVRHHCHVSGDFLYAACNNCNLQLKVTSRKRKGRDDGQNKKNTTMKRRKKKHRKSDNGDRDNDDVDDGDGGGSGNEYDCMEDGNSTNFYLPVVFHNLKCYDAHFVIKHFKKQYTERVNGDQPSTYDDVKVIPLNSEKYMMFQVGNLRFLDSFQFMSASLEHLVSLLLKSGSENFPNTIRYLTDDDLVFAKGVYPYSYVTSREKFEDTQLPPIEAFHNTLTDEPLDGKDYERAQETWMRFGMRTLRDYHDHYLKSDVLLLADVMENFRNNVMEEHKLDCLHFISLPSLAWTSALKYTNVQLDLITDPDAYLMIENNMRGGIAIISHRHAVANNPLVEGYDDTKPTSYITYLDANNLYGDAMRNPLPIGKFRFLTQTEIDTFDLLSIPPDADTGYVIECDLEYPDHLHSLHSDYPLAPEHVTVDADMLSPFAKQYIGERWKPSKKLIPNLSDKTNYVSHYRNLQFYVNHGLVLKKIHRILSFQQGPWLKPWIDHCTMKRKMAKSEFESDLAKLQANATFGKTMEQVRHRVNIRLICDQHKLTKAVSRVTFRQSEIINDDLVMVRGAKKSVTLNKPISVGFAILEISKLIMYTFYYDYLKPKYGDRCRLLFTDTDSLCCHIETDDLYADMWQNLELFDTSNFESKHPLYSLKNHRVLGKFKSETGSVAPSEFVGLRAKMYSLHVPNLNKHSKMRAKGIKKSYVKKHVRHQQFLDVLQTRNSTLSRFRTFQSKNHVLQTVEITKSCLNAFDDKRYILDDGVTTLAYGHCKIGRE